VQNNWNNGFGMMGGYGLWPVLGILLAVLLVVAIMRMSKTK
jgi:uncharacterized membrane protein